MSEHGDMSGAITTGSSARKRAWDLVAEHQSYHGQATKKLCSGWSSSLETTPLRQWRLDTEKSAASADLSLLDAFEISDYATTSCPDLLEGFGGIVQFDTANAIPPSTGLDGDSARTEATFNGFVPAHDAEQGLLGPSSGTAIGIFQDQQTTEIQNYPSGLSSCTVPWEVPSMTVQAYPQHVGFSGGLLSPASPFPSATATSPNSFCFPSIASSADEDSYTPFGLPVGGPEEQEPSAWPAGEPLPLQVDDKEDADIVDCTATVAGSEQNFDSTVAISSRRGEKPYDTCFGMVRILIQKVKRKLTFLGYSHDLLHLLQQIRGWRRPYTYEYLCIWKLTQAL